MIEYVPLFVESEDPEMRRGYMQCRRCGRHVTNRVRAGRAHHVSTWHRKDVKAGIIVRNGTRSHRIRSDAPTVPFRRGYDG